MRRRIFNRVSTATETGRGRVRASLREGRREWFRIEAKAAEKAADVYIYDEIGYWGVSANDFAVQLAALDVSTINLKINSPGGEVFDGVAIYNAIKNHPATVNVSVDGLAASAASFIAMAGDTVKMARGSQMMIHDALAICIGNAADMIETAGLLDKISETIASLYAEKAGGTITSWRDAMRAETWYTADEAVAAGLADEAVQPVTDPKAATNQWDLSIFNYAGRDHAPAPKIVNEVHEPADEPAPEPAPEAVPAAEPVVDPVEPASEPGQETEPVADQTPASLGAALTALTPDLFRNAIAAALPTALDPDMFRAAVCVVTENAPEPVHQPAPAPPNTPFDARPAAFLHDPTPPPETAPQASVFDPAVFRSAIGLVTNDMPAPHQQVPPEEPEPAEITYSSVIKDALRRAKL